MADKCISKVAIKMVPLPAQGHLSQFLYLFRLISLYNIPVHCVGSNAHIQQAKARVYCLDTHITTNIQFHEFQTPFETPLPNPNVPHKFPNHLILVILRSITSPRPRFLAYLSEMPNTECYCFNSILDFHRYSYFWEVKRKPTI
ncbi:hypothetical protein P3S68_030975 [Capsicum galapagoense]